MEPTPRSLYGGKVTVDLPAAWTDMADQRPVPDHQEVYCEPDGGLGRNVIFEIVERAATNDRLAAQYFFYDVAQAGGASMKELQADEAWDEAAASSGATRRATRDWSFSRRASRSGSITSARRRRNPMLPRGETVDS
mmetsp:Transcript_7875/g.23443  ORF Transcript_7875/g.23443 Transcript_7875/m.23443 type:complete len:137 (+) Transcript_7875:219-629(+)